MLVVHFLQKLKGKRPDYKAVGIASAALEALMNYIQPGDLPAAIRNNREKQRASHGIGEAR